MKKLCLLVLVITVAILTGCAALGIKSSDESNKRALATAQAILTILTTSCDAAPIAFGVALQTGIINQADYDNDLAITTRVCAGITAAQAALNDVRTAGSDPNGDPAYQQALANLAGDRALLADALKAAGVQPVAQP